MTKLNEVYKCSVCGNVVSVMVSGAGTLVCCGKNMDLLKEKTGTEEGKEKHVPVVKINQDNVEVNVGSIDHPMTAEHHIVLIQLVRGGEVVAGQRLKPGDKPHASFCIDNTEGIKARIFCNIHGLW
ncbi:MAG: desulfoferrodoxin, partial [Nanoarchaeota archaeon]|nr:desulfoferrodoxin [Nanoarchaeota archaeon]